MRNNKERQIVFKLIDEFKESRLRQGLSHESLAKLAEMHRTSIGLIENKKRIPTILTCLKIARALNIDLAKTLAKFK